MKYLVGYTGFVGSNICESAKFDGVFNSKNIKEAYGKNPDLLVYCGVPAEKFIANSHPLEDMKIIYNAIDNIKKINSKEIVLISTIDVYKNPDNVDEDEKNNMNNEPYGKNRYFLEKWVMDNFTNYLIVRLPGLFGKNIKKNFIYDLINIIPSMLTKEKYEELKDDILSRYYFDNQNGFYKIKDINVDERKMLKNYFKEKSFNALSFTDSRGNFQFYNLKNLWNDIEIARNNHLKIVNLATEPINIGELYQYIEKKNFKNYLNKNIPNYNFKTKYYDIFHGKDGYIIPKEQVMKEILDFVKENEL